LTDWTEGGQLRSKRRNQIRIQRSNYLIGCRPGGTQPSARGKSVPTAHDPPEVGKARPARSRPWSDADGSHRSRRNNAIGINGRLFGGPSSTPPQPRSLNKKYSNQKCIFGPPRRPPSTPVLPPSAPAAHATSAQFVAAKNFRIENAARRNAENIRTDGGSREGLALTLCRASQGQSGG